MRKRIIRSFLLMFVFSMLIAFGFLYMMVYNIYLKDEVASMENTIDLIETDRLDAPNLVNYLKETGSRLTIINPDGNVEYDSRGLDECQPCRTPGSAAGTGKRHRRFHPVFCYS